MAQIQPFSVSGLSARNPLSGIPQTVGGASVPAFTPLTVYLATSQTYTVAVGCTIIQMGAAGAGCDSTSSNTNDGGGAGLAGKTFRAVDYGLAHFGGLPAVVVVGAHGVPGGNTTITFLGKSFTGNGGTQPTGGTATGGDTNFSGGSGIGPIGSHGSGGGGCAGFKANGGNGNGAQSAEDGGGGGFSPTNVNSYHMSPGGGGGYGQPGGPAGDDTGLAFVASQTLALKFGNPSSDAALPSPGAAGQWASTSNLSGGVGGFPGGGGGAGWSGSAAAIGGNGAAILRMF